MNLWGPAHVETVKYHRHVAGLAVVGIGMTAGSQGLAAGPTADGFAGEAASELVERVAGEADRGDLWFQGDPL
jgi:hypothetical protein